jgi:hypothetical protein
MCKKVLIWGFNSGFKATWRGGEDNAGKRLPGKFNRLSMFKFRLSLFDKSLHPFFIARPLSKILPWKALSVANSGHCLYY